MRSSRLFGLVVLAVMVPVVLVASDKQAGGSSSSNLYFTVVKDDNNKPVRNASVIMHPVEKNGKQSKGGFQLKTDGDGKASTEGLPYGPLRIQVLAPGFQTFGEDYDINKPVMNIDIRLKRPSEQMSIYDKPKDQQPAVPPASAPPPKP